MALDYLLAKEGGHCNVLGIIDPENCVMLLPDSSENMTAIIDKIADLSKTLSKSEKSVFGKIGDWFNAKCLNVMGKVMLTLFSLFTPILVGGLVILVTVYICKKMTVTALDHAGVMVLLEADRNLRRLLSGVVSPFSRPTLGSNGSGGLPNLFDFRVEIYN